MKAGSRTNQVAHLIDVLPTCLEVAGASALQEICGAQPSPLEGQSLAPVLRGDKRDAPAQLFWEWGGNLAVREGRWKAVWDAENPARQWQLYDIDADRTEMNGVARQHPELVERLSAAYERWARNLGRKQPGPIPIKGSVRADN